MAEYVHQPVLTAETLQALNVRAGGSYLDATLGEGGHSRAILEACRPGGRVLGLDADASVVPIAQARLAEFGDAFRGRGGNYADMAYIAASEGMEQFDGILFDLGFSSRQVEDGGRGFSFQRSGPLDMRFDPSQGLSAADIVNHWPEEELAQTIREYGEEPRARRIAAGIVRKRPIGSTEALASIVSDALGGGRRKIHPATRTFQALRIRVNRELENLRQGLESAVEMLKTGGRLAVITYHSLEASLVKAFMRRESGACVCPPEQPVCTCRRVERLKRITRKAIAPTEEEVAHNPRARSARLRVGERV